MPRLPLIFVPRKDVLPLSYLPALGGFRSRSHPQMSKRLFESQVKEASNRRNSEASFGYDGSGSVNSKEPVRFYCPITAISPSSTLSPALKLAVAQSARHRQEDDRDFVKEQKAIPRDVRHGQAHYVKTQKTAVTVTCPKKPTATFTIAPFKAHCGREAGCHGVRPARTNESSRLSKGNLSARPIVIHGATGTRTIS